MIVLDTNVLSEVMKPAPSANVAKWMLREHGSGLYTTAVCEAEIRLGIAVLSDGKRKQDLETAALRVTPAAGKPWHRAQAEAEWLRLHAEHGVPVHVFRLGGIYGALLGSRLGDTSQPHQARAAACWMCGAGRRVRRRGRAGRSGTSPAATWRTL